MRAAGDGVHGRRLRGLIVVLWRAGLRIHGALALTEPDLDARRGSLLVRRGKGGRRREVGMDDWAWEQLEPWLKARVELPIGPLFCVVSGPTRGRPWSASAARSDLRHVARQAGVRRRFAPHQLRHAHAVEMAREGVPLIVIQRQLGHTNLGITSIYLQGIDNAEIIDTVHARRAPMVPVQKLAARLSPDRRPRSSASLGRRCSSSAAIGPPRESPQTAGFAAEQKPESGLLLVFYERPTPRSQRRPQTRRKQQRAITPPAEEAHTSARIGSERRSAAWEQTCGREAGNLSSRAGASTRAPRRGR